MELLPQFLRFTYTLCAKRVVTTGPFSSKIEITEAPYYGRYGKPYLKKSIVNYLFNSVLTLILMTSDSLHRNCDFYLSIKILFCYFLVIRFRYRKFQQYTHIFIVLAIYIYIIYHI